MSCYECRHGSGTRGRPEDPFCFAEVPQQNAHACILFSWQQSIVLPVALRSLVARFAVHSHVPLSRPPGTVLVPLGGVAPIQTLNIDDRPKGFRERGFGFRAWGSGVRVAEMKMPL